MAAAASTPAVTITSACLIRSLLLQIAASLCAHSMVGDVIHRDRPGGQPSAVSIKCRGGKFDSFLCYRTAFRLTVRLCRGSGDRLRKGNPGSRADADDQERWCAPYGEEDKSDEGY